MPQRLHDPSSMCLCMWQLQSQDDVEMTLGFPAAKKARADAPTESYPAGVPKVCLSTSMHHPLTVAPACYCPGGLLEA